MKRHGVKESHYLKMSVVLLYHIPALRSRHGLMACYGSPGSCSGFAMIMQEPELLAGWTFSFTRALFGPLPTCDKLQIIHAVPTEGCRKQPLFVQTENGPPGILLTARGTCKFEDKAFVATESGASALFVSTTKDGDVS